MRAKENEMADIDDRIAAAAPVEVLPREDLVRECRRLREETAALRAQQSGNYVADDAVEPHKVTFANGRTVEVGADGVLQVGWALAALEEAGR